MTVEGDEQDVDRTGDAAFVTVSASSAEAQRAMAAYFAELNETFPAGFDPGDALTSGVDMMGPPGGVFVLVRLDGVPAGCGGLLTLEPEIGEIKRMWIAPAARGLGLARRLLEDLEARSRALGHHTVRLDTNATLTRAIAMYERAGYRSIGRYNDNPYAQRWFEKRLT